MRSRRATGGRPTPCGVATTRRRDNGAESDRSVSELRAPRRVRCRCSRPEPGDPPGHSHSPPKRQAARPAEGCCRSQAPIPPKWSGCEVPRAVRSTRVRAVSFGRSPIRRVVWCRRSSPGAAAGRSRWRCWVSPSDAPAGRRSDPWTAVMTHCTDLPSAVGGRVDPCRAKARPRSSRIRATPMLRCTTVVRTGSPWRGRSLSASPGPSHGRAGRSTRTGAHGARH